ncbi:uncharacterized protein L203_104330 [Cryptococcus depauperatus CBS 7841]|uniref:Uncharacterized protein n=1 Tax=Cryptococcus depauperatus CBS 7841 TaxID=1295531 RepID=A0AAJ8JVB5_9TREE
MPASESSSTRSKSSKPSSSSRSSSSSRPSSSSRSSSSSRPSSSSRGSSSSKSSGSKSGRGAAIAKTCNYYRYYMLHKSGGWLASIIIGLTDITGLWEITITAILFIISWTTLRVGEVEVSLVLGFAFDLTIPLQYQLHPSYSEIHANHLEKYWPIFFIGTAVECGAFLLVHPDVFTLVVCLKTTILLCLWMGRDSKGGYLTDKFGGKDKSRSSSDSSGGNRRSQSSRGSSDPNGGGDSSGRPTDGSNGGGKDKDRSGKKKEGENSSADQSASAAPSRRETSGKDSTPATPAEPSSSTATQTASAEKNTGKDKSNSYDPTRNLQPIRARLATKPGVKEQKPSSRRKR